MTDTYKELPFDQLKTLHRQIGALIAEKRVQELERLREQMGILGFTADDLVQKKPSGKASAKYRDPENPTNTYAGNGPKPQWLRDALDAGRQLEEFAIA